MNSSLTSSRRRYHADAARAFERAPVEGVVVLSLAVAFSYAVELGDDAVATWAQFFIACVLLLAGAWTGTLLHALGAWAARARWAATAAGAGAAALYAGLVPNLELTSEVWRAVLLAGAAAAWVLAVPALGGPRAGAVDRVREIDGRFLLRAIGALLYTAALFAGLALAVAAIDNLFELDLDEAIYAHVGGWLFLVLAPSIVVGGLPEFARPVAPRPEVAGLAHRMTAFLVPPLLALYYAILYAYALRMALTGEVPKNLLSPMVLAAGVLGALALYLFEPRPNGTAGSRHLRFAPPLFVPLAVLGIWAITLRVDQYGWTEFRLVRLIVLAVLGVFAVAASVQLLARRRRLALHIAPFVLAAALLFAAVGPWSVLTHARRSQQTRIAAVLRLVGTGSATTDTPRTPRTIPADLYDDLRSTAQYLAQHFGREALPRVLAVHASEPGAIYDLPQRLGLQRAVPPGERGPFGMAQLPASAGVDVAGVTVHRVVLAEQGAPTPGAAIVVGAARLRIRNATELLWADLSPIAALLATATHRRAAIELPSTHARLDVTDSAGRRRGSLVVFSATGQSDSAGQLKLYGLEALLLLDDGFTDQR